MGKFICIHGHFYQPPRENPWLESVELQDSAAPYHDWNERITYECYAPNARARLLDGEGRIERIVSNYSRISFNFGPTLLSWMKGMMPDVHDAIVEADKQSRERFSGHGSALAQCYNHMIMPLASSRDKYTQALWGIRDFKFRFGREPEGMWLPETAVDNESLEVLASLGIQFTILSPYQAARTRSLSGQDKWTDVNGGKIDPSKPYLVRLPSGRTMTVFFYDGPIARAVAFERLLSSGEHLANRLLGAFAENGNEDRLVHIATDGESYGHHFHNGDMALAYALHMIENNPGVRLTVYGEYLEKHPPADEVEIHQSSAWSCSHGVDRWRRDCGCNSGGHGGWNQKWREPLRNALDHLRDRLVPLHEKQSARFFKDPWTARNDYIDVILDRSQENIGRFFGRHGIRGFNETDQVSALRLLEIQRHAMLMYTSCGWFFDEISGVETVQVIQYAARAIQLATELSGEDFEPAFLEALAQAGSNIPEHKDGSAIYRKFVKPAVMTRETVGAHYAVSSLFESYPEEAGIYSFIVRQNDRQLFTSGNARLAIGRIRVIFTITRSSEDLVYGVIHMGDHNLDCGVRQENGAESYRQLIDEMKAAFQRADFPELIRMMDRHFGQTHYSIKNLFRDEQRKVLNQILATTRDEIHNTYRLLTDRYAPLSRFLADIHVPPLNVLAPATEFVLNTELRKQFENGRPDAERIRSLLAEVETIQAHLDNHTLQFAIKRHMDSLSDEFSKNPGDMELLKHFSDSAGIVGGFPVKANLWKAQNIYDRVRQTVLPQMRDDNGENGDKSKEWIETFFTLGERLGFRVDRNSA